MKKVITILVVLVACAKLSAQSNARLSAAQQATPVKDTEVKAKADVLYGKTQPAQQKDLIFRQSVLDGTDKDETIDYAAKAKLLDNSVKRVYTTNINKPN